MAVAVAAYDGRIIIAGLKGERSVAVADFYHPPGNDLANDEMIREIEIPIINNPSWQNYIKFTLRKPIDFAIVSVASNVKIEKGVCRDARIILGAVAHFPVRVKVAEEMLIGKTINKEIAEAAADKALEGSNPLSKNKYKIQIAKALIKQAVMGATG